MPINGFLYPGAKFTPSYEVANSLRFNSASADSLTRSTSGAGTSNTTFTISLWVKKSSNDSAARRLLEFYNNSSYYISLRFRDDVAQNLDFYSESNGSAVNLRTNRGFRDPSSWYHIVMRVDTTQSTADDRLRMYVNGVQETSFAARTNPSSSENLQFNGSGVTHLISQSGSDTANDRRFNGYMAEVCFIDGQSLDPTSFGEFDSDSPNIWKPIDVSGLTFGNNGFYLDFEDSSSLGNDAVGSNNFTANNLAAADQATDTCTNNFATFNPLDGTSTGTAFVLSEGNCKGVTAVDTNGALQSTMAVSSGKWYAEFKIAKVGDNLSGGRTTVGIGSRTNSQVSGNYYGNTASPVDSYGKYSASAHYYSNNGSTTSYGSSFVDDDIIGVYLDLDNNKLYFSENGTLYSSTGIDITAAASTLNGHYHIGVADASANDNGEYLANYGGCPAFTISSAVSDDNGYGSFEYSPNITGDGEAKKFYALCTKNLAEYG